MVVMVMVDEERVWSIMNKHRYVMNDRWCGHELDVFPKMLW
jgi:hypothetical protein